jgi:hypothetical protein
MKELISKNGRLSIKEHVVFGKIFIISLIR